MGLWDNLLELALKLTDPTPRFSPERCLLERHAVGGCSACADACPHQAVDLSGYTVEIDDARCTGCGLCVAACPGVALEYPLGPLQEALAKGRGRLKCSRAPGQGEEVLCLGRLTPGLLAWAGSRLGPLTLARGDCEGCKIGGPEVPKRLEAAIREARRYYPELEVKVTTEPLEGPAVGRRELFRGLFQSARRVAAEALPEPPPELVPEEGEALPAELRLRRLAAERASEVRWPGVRVEEGCTLCPVCQNVCPTSAIRRYREGEERVLELELARCTGCNACVESCPPQVMAPADYGKEELSSGVLELFRGVPWD